MGIWEGAYRRQGVYAAVVTVDAAAWAHRGVALACGSAIVEAIA
jgi:hypothetical protein